MIKLFRFRLSFVNVFKDTLSTMNFELSSSVSSRNVFAVATSLLYFNNDSLSSLVHRDRDIAIMTLNSVERARRSFYLASKSFNELRIRQR